VKVSVIICLITTIVSCVCQVSRGRPYVGLRRRVTNLHHTVDKNGVHLKLQCSCIKLNY